MVAGSTTGHVGRTRLVAVLVVLSTLLAVVWWSVSDETAPDPTAAPPTADGSPGGLPSTPASEPPAPIDQAPGGGVGDQPPNLADPSTPLPLGPRGDEEIALVVNDPEAARAVVAARPVAREGITVLDQYTVVYVPSSALAEVVADLRSLGVSEIIEDPVVRRAAPVTPTDPLWSLWWGARTSGLPEAWGVTQGSDDTVIAVVDSGVQPVSELTIPAPGGVPAVSRVLPGATWVGGDPAVDPDGHGTLTAVTAAGAINNQIGAGGACPRCAVLPLKVFPDPSVPGEETVASLSDVAAAIEYAADWESVGRRVGVVNLSLGSNSNASVMRDAVAYASAAGVTLVASAGNDGDEVLVYPAAYPEVVSVAGVNEDLVLNGQSSRGASWVDTAAPWTNISQNSDGGFFAFGGTSSAAPIVSGSVALLLDGSPGIDPVVVHSEVLAASAQPATPIATAAGVFNAGVLLATSVGPPTDVVVEPGDQRIVVRWREPAETPPGGVTGYRVSTSVDGGRFWTVAADEVSEPTVVLDGLPNGVTHLVRVAAIVRGTLGPWSGWSIPATPAVPGSLVDVFCGYLDLRFGRLTTSAACSLDADGLMFGLSATLYGVDTSLTRGQAVTILWRRAGRPPAPLTCGYTDVPLATASQRIVSQAICWAKQERIATGYGNGTFAPQAPATRAQAISFLWREAGRPPAPLLCGFSDVPIATSGQRIFAQSICWGREEGIVAGYADGTYAPSASVTRGHYAAMLWRQGGRPAPPPPAPPEALALWFDTSRVPGTRIALALGEGEVLVDWGDGTSEVVGGPATVEHLYARNGYYLVTLVGELEGFGSTASLAGASALVAISNFGELGIEDFVWPVPGATNLSVVTRNLPRPS